MVLNLAIDDSIERLYFSVLSCYRRNIAARTARPDPQKKINLAIGHVRVFP